MNTCTNLQIIFTLKSEALPVMWILFTVSSSLGLLSNFSHFQMFIYQNHFRDGKILKWKTKFSEDSPFLSTHSSTIVLNGKYIFFMSSLSKAINSTIVELFLSLPFLISKKLLEHYTYIPPMNFYNFLVNFDILSFLSHKPRRISSLVYF